MADYDEVRQILREAAKEGETLTTIGEIDLPAGEFASSPVVKLVVKGERGEPIVMTGDLLDKNDHFREALVSIGPGFTEFPFDHPVLLIHVTADAEADAA